MSPTVPPPDTGNSNGERRSLRSRFFSMRPFRAKRGVSFQVFSHPGAPGKLAKFHATAVRVNLVPRLGGYGPEPAAIAKRLRPAAPSSHK
jgi:hypothetical protein